MASNRHFSRLICLILFLAKAASAHFQKRFNNKHEERRFLEERHHEQREHILRSMTEDQTVFIVATVDDTCTASLPQDFKRSNGRPMKVSIETYEYMYLHKKQLCISMIETDPVVTLQSSVIAATFVTGANDQTTTAVNLVTQEYQSWGVQAILNDVFPPNNKWQGDGRPPVGVCIVDSGAEVDHPDFPWGGVSNAKVDGASFDVGNAQWNVSQSVAWHGTFVSGLICAQRGNGMGIRGIVGDCANKVELHIARVFGPDDTSQTLMSTIDKAVEWCLTKGSKVINLSLATSVYSYNSEVIYKKIFEENEALLVAAGGNGGPTAQPSYPAYYPEVFSVGAVDSTMAVASFSQKFVDVLAPGVNMISTSVNFGVETKAQGYAVTPMNFSPVPDLVSSGPSCNCGCALNPCQCSQPNSICLINRCPSNGFSATSQAKMAEAGGCAGAIISAPDQATLYSNFPNMNYKSSIPVVYAATTEASAIMAATAGTNMTIDFAYPNYKISDGSSFACPLVAGLAALLLYERPACTASQIRGAIQNSAKAVSGNKNLTGYGFVQGLPAYQKLLQEPSPCGNAAVSMDTAIVTEDVVASTSGGTTTTTPATSSSILGSSLYDMFPGLSQKSYYGSSSSSSSSSTYKQKSFGNSRTRGSGFSLRQRAR